MKYLLFLVMMAAGIFMVAKSFLIVRIMGKNAWAEEKLGIGGTYTAWKIIGILTIIASYYMLVKPEVFGLS